jgi:hypothetical protein
MRAALAATFALAVASLAAPRPAAADPPPAAVQPRPQPASDAAPRARALLQEASRLYTDGEYTRALEAFQRSYAFDPSWRALNGIALCQRELGQDVAAYRSYQQLLDDFGAILTAEQRTVAGERQRELGARIGRLEISVAQGGVRITLDGRVIGRGPLRVTELVLPGSHQVVATGPGLRAHARHIEVAAGGIQRVAIALEKDRARVVVKYTDAPATRPMPVWVPWVTMGGGAVLAGAGGLLALGAKSDVDDFDGQVASMSGDPPVPAMVDDGLLARSDDKKTAAAVLAIGGAVAIVTGVTLAIMNRKRGGPRPATALRPGASGFAVSIEF